MQYPVRLAWLLTLKQACFSSSFRHGFIGLTCFGGHPIVAVRLFEGCLKERSQWIPPRK